jgi:hypothetical protein
LAAVHEVVTADDERLIWETPLARIGYYVAQAARKAGIKGVERKKDFAAALAILKKEMEKANGTAKTDI